MPYFLDSSVAESSKISHNPHNPVNSTSLQMSHVSQWNGGSASFQPTASEELTAKIASLSERIDSH